MIEVYKGHYFHGKQYFLTNSDSEIKTDSNSKLWKEIASDRQWHQNSSKVFGPNLEESKGDLDLEMDLSAISYHEAVILMAIAVRLIAMKWVSGIWHAVSQWGSI